MAGDAGFGRGRPEHGFGAKFHLSGLRVYQELRSIAPPFRIIPGVTSCGNGI
jgi:hypothetical protein